jgi:hypothetical protein
MSAAKLESLRALEEEFGEVVKSGFTGRSIYYCAKWEEILTLAIKEARRQDLSPPIEDVRCANYALDVLGIPNSHSEADQDERGNWIVYWR